MEKLTGMVERLSRVLDIIAGACLAGVMLLVVGNVLMRQILNIPILGTYEIVGYLTALGISFALAGCAFQNGHIALDYLVNKFPDKLRVGADIIVNAISSCFWALCAWHMFKYGQSLMASGVVSPTAQVSIYIFAYLIAIGLLGLCLVPLERLINSCLTAIKGLETDILSQSGSPQPVQGRR